MQQPEEPRIEVFTQPHCAPCRQVEVYLRQRGVPFVIRDVVADPGALQELAERGFMGTPVTRLADVWVAGFDRKPLDAALGRLLA